MKSRVRWVVDGCRQARRDDYVERDCKLCGFFFFQAEDGIRDYKVTGVQTCALPIWAERSLAGPDERRYGFGYAATTRTVAFVGRGLSEKGGGSKRTGGGSNNRHQEPAHGFFSSASVVFQAAVGFPPGTAPCDDPPCRRSAMRPVRNSHLSCQADARPTR